MDKWLTIIIPVYRVADTIDRCLESIVGQRCDGMEIILVDDGSPDGCPDMCDRWAERDDRIVVVHKNNGGLSSARNAGLDIARGEYVTFVDSDDFVAPDTYGCLMDIVAAHPEYDILEFPVYRFFGSKEQQVMWLGCRAYTDMTDYWMVERAYEHSYAWNKIYRRGLFGEVRFPVGKVFEDMYTLPLLLEKAAVAATTDRGMYYYCCNEGGITARAGGREWRMLLDAHMAVMERYAGHRLFAQYYIHVVNIQLYEYELTGDSPRLPHKRVACIASMTRKQRLKIFLINILGIRGLCVVSKYTNKMLKLH